VYFEKRGPGFVIVKFLPEDYIPRYEPGMFEMVAGISTALYLIVLFMSVFADLLLYFVILLTPITITILFSRETFFMVRPSEKTIYNSLQKSGRLYVNTIVDGRGNMSVYTFDQRAREIKQIGFLIVFEPDEELSYV